MKKGSGPETRYRKPEITRHELKLNESILAACKMNSVGFTGPTGIKCKKGQRPCKDYSSS